MLNLLSTKEDDVSYSYPSSWKTYWRFKETQLPGTPTFDFRLSISGLIKRTTLLRASQHDFPRIEFLEVGTDLIHSNCRLLVTRIPYVLVFDTPNLLTTFRSGKSFGDVGRMLCRDIGLRKCAKFMPFSQAAADHFQKLSGVKIPDNVLEIMPPGVEIPPRIDRSRLNSDKPVRFLFVGRRQFKLKGGYILLEAFSKLYQRYQKIHLTMIVSENIEVPSKLKENVTVIPRFLSNEDMTRLYRSVDVFVFPTTYDAFGLVCLEAMANGIPVVGSNFYAVPEIVNNGETGLLFETGNSEDLAEKLSKLAMDEDFRLKLGEASYGRAKSTFSNEIINGRLQKVYREALAG